MVDSKLKDQQDATRKWTSAQSARLDAIEEATKDSNTSLIAKLDEKIASLEHKLDALANSITAHGTEETRMISEAYRIIKDRKATEEEVTSEPSVYDRMEARVETLNASLRNLEPALMTSAVSTQVKPEIKARVRGKFGKMM
jgi:outer membrane murein-binding lipoprotein Lpp